MLCYAPHHVVIEECTLNVYRHVHPDRGPWVRGGKATRGVLRAGKKRAAGSLNARQALRAARTLARGAKPPCRGGVPGHYPNARSHRVALGPETAPCEYCAELTLF